MIMNSYLIIKIKKQKVLNKKSSLEKQYKDLVSIKNQIQFQEKILLKQKLNQKKHIKSINAQIKKLERQNKEYERSSLKLSEYIKTSGKGVKNFAIGNYIKPSKGWYSSYYGKRKHPIFKRYIMHNGLDIAAPRGYKIRASNSGVVLISGQRKAYKGYGKVTVIDHGYNKKYKKSVDSLCASIKNFC